MSSGGPAVRLPSLPPERRRRRSANRVERSPGMVKKRVVGLLTGCLLYCGGVSRVDAAPTVQQMLGFRPKQEGIVVSTPAAAELDTCKVELVTGSKQGSNGWLLRDAKGQPLRRYFDSN